jgi:hypothetical protein
MGTEKLNTALQLAEAGLARVPAHPRGQDARWAPWPRTGRTTPPPTGRQIVRWWSQAPQANVGIATAASGLYVVDIDSHGTRKDGTPKVGRRVVGP